MFDLLMMLAACGFLYAGFAMVREAGRGERWIVLRRRSSRAPGEVFRALERHWEKDALTFQPVRIDAESTADRKSFSADLGGRTHRTTIERRPADRPMTIAVTCTSANGIAYPLGRDHRKVWVVRSLADGRTEVMVAVRLVAPAGAIFQAIRSFARQLDAVA